MSGLMSGGSSGGSGASSGGGMSSLGGILQRLGNTSGGAGNQFSTTYNPAAQFLPQTTPQLASQDQNAQKPPSLKEIIEMLSGKKQG